jgi:hypothetical protein
MADEESAGFAGLCDKTGGKPVVWRGKKENAGTFPVLTGNAGA